MRPHSATKRDARTVSPPRHNRWRDFSCLRISSEISLDEDGSFTTVEHAVLAGWFGREPIATAAHVELNDALEELGFGDICPPYTQLAAAAALHSFRKHRGPAAGLGVLAGEPNTYVRATIASRIRNHDAKRCSCPVSCSQSTGPRRVQGSTGQCSTIWFGCHTTNASWLLRLQTVPMHSGMPTSRSATSHAVMMLANPSLRSSSATGACSGMSATKTDGKT